MKKQANSILVLLFLFGLAFASLPLGTRSSRKDMPNTDAKTPENSLIGNQQTLDTTPTANISIDTAEIETRSKYEQLQIAYQSSLQDWNADQEQLANIQKQKIDFEKNLKELIATKQESPAFEPREWASSDGKFKTIATLISSDFRTAKIKKEDGTVIEVSKEKLSDADKQVIERAFAVIEVANKKNKDRQKQIDDIRANIKESIDKIRSLTIEKPVEPTIEDAKRILMAEKEIKAKGELTREAGDPNLLDNRFIEILETKVTDRVNAAGVPVDVIETKFKNIGAEPVRVIDVEYLVSDANGKVVLRQPYTLFVALNENSGLKPGDTLQTKDDGLYLPKHLAAKKAKVEVTKVISFKRLDASKVGNNGQDSLRDYVPSGIHFISSREDPRTPGDFMHVYWSNKKPLELNELVSFCRAFREKEAGKRFSYIVVFDTKENAAFPQNPYTALYGVDFDILEHIRFYYECNKVNGYSKLTFVKDRPPSGATNSIDIP